ncbi:hypothetical protein Leryth_026988 [Lithospermum erythrorhizon]|nr:hypothetical protein Leryth_026988 [Lithospermum erythrorhizon]
MVYCTINETVHKLFLVHMASSYRNFVARMKRSALRRAKITVASSCFIKYPDILKNRFYEFGRVGSNTEVTRWWMGTHAGGSRTHTRSSALIVDETGEMPLIAKRLRLQYGKKDDEGNPTDEMVNPTSKQVLREWTDVVKTKYGPDAEVDESRDKDLYMTLPLVRTALNSRKQNFLDGCNLMFL